ncbi:6769_t:CDS:2 [Paraglomus occultum]|uniref:6769_t:CDS:1 n=1 Tax=Paraglomus occultum TaxID=144539 RepID=A0A9N8YWF9_9GLOM|nr:6769_t:CDS:2 [Paraglomus occultum]
MQQTGSADAFEDDFSHLLDAPVVQSETFHTVRQKVLPHLSNLELEELQLPVDAFVDSEGFALERSLGNLTSFINFVDPELKLKERPSETGNGSPLIIIIAISAARSVKLRRAMIEYKSSNIKIAKLFGKHFKFKDQEKFLELNFINIAVTTPERILKMVNDSKSLDLSRLKYIIIDATWKDVKERSVFDDGCKELMLLFANSLLLEKIKVKKETKIALY